MITFTKIKTCNMAKIKTKIGQLVVFRSGHSVGLLIMGSNPNGHINFLLSQNHKNYNLQKFTFILIYSHRSYNHNHL